MVLVVSEKEKDTSSTSGMETSRLTSPLLAHRAAHVVEPRLAAIEAAYLRKDFSTFGTITMQDSNQFHAVCLDTYPPIFYLNDVSKAIIKLVHAYNTFHNEVRAAYTFDAGPNAVIYTLDAHVDDLLAMAALHFPAPNGNNDKYCNAPQRLSAAPAVSAELAARYAATGHAPRAGDVKYVFVTKAGPGPQRQLTESLLDPASGMPAQAGPKHQRMKIGE